MKKNKKHPMDKKKTARIAYISTGAFLVFGLACVIVGYGLSSGWDVVASWFTSRYAVYVAVFAVLYLFGAVMMWWYGRHNR